MDWLDEREHLRVLCALIESTWHAAHLLREMETRKADAHIWEHAHTIISNAATISKFFYGDPPTRHGGKKATQELIKKVKERRAHLRSVLFFGTDLVFEPPQKVRNILQHLDEFLDEHLLDQTNKNEAPSTQFWSYDPVSKIYCCLGTEVNLINLVTAIETLGLNISRRFGQKNERCTLDSYLQTRSLPRRHEILGSLHFTIQCRLSDIRQRPSGQREREQKLLALQGYLDRIEHIDTLSNYAAGAQIEWILKDIIQYCSQYQPSYVFDDIAFEAKRAQERFAT